MSLRRGSTSTASRPRSSLRALALLVAALGACATATARTPAAVPTTTQREVEALIAALGDSGCRFQRNGTWHDARAAQAHLRRKYDWLRERDRVSSAEQFIDVGASRSSMTGRAYQVRCEGQPTQTAAQWLLARLAQIRRAAPGR